MASAWIERRTTANGRLRYRVEYRLGGRGSQKHYAGSFRTMREAQLRKAFIIGELAAHRVPDLTPFAESVSLPAFAQLADRWQASRVDAAEATRLQHRSAVRLMTGALPAGPADQITAQQIADAVGALHSAGKKRETIRKALVAAAMVFDHAGIDPNPARDKVTIKLPREEREEPTPPSAEHVEAVYWLLPHVHRLALLWLDHSGARVGSVDDTLVGDYDEPRRRVRLRAAVTKSRRAVWVELPDVLADAIETSIGPREDRDPAGRLFEGSGAHSLRTCIGRACAAAAVPTFSPHDLRHRRISLLHARGMPWARIGELVGQRDLAVTANTYTHVLVDENELDYGSLLTAT